MKKWTSRKITNEIIEICEDTNCWEAVARECLAYMSESEVEDMNRAAEFVEIDEEEE